MSSLHFFVWCTWNQFVSRQFFLPSPFSLSLDPRVSFIHGSCCVYIGQQWQQWTVKTERRERTHHQLKFSPLSHCKQHFTFNVTSLILASSPYFVVLFQNVDGKILCQCLSLLVLYFCSTLSFAFPLSLFETLFFTLSMLFIPKNIFERTTDREKERWMAAG